MMRRLLALALVLLAAQAWAAPPTFVANGAAAVTASTTTCTPTMPGSISADDILLLVACGEGDGSGGALTLTTANGFAAVSGITNPQSGDDGDATEETGECDCAVWWKRAVGGDSAPVVTDSDNHTTCAVHQFRGTKTTGNPWNVANSNNEATSDTSASITGASTTVADTLVVLVQGTSNNATATTNCGAVTNANLGSITERFDSSNTSGLGGGHCIITGTWASTGDYGASTLTMGAATMKAAFSIALEPPPPASTVLKDMIRRGVIPWKR
jgi:hypothetical protein